MLENVSFSTSSRVEVSYTKTPGASPCFNWPMAIRRPSGLNATAPALMSVAMGGDGRMSKEVSAAVPRVRS